MAPNDTIRQWVTSQDGIENLQFTTAQKPKLQDDEVLVRINAVSLNYRDIEVVMGLYGHHKSISQGSNALVPCSDMCGTVESSSLAEWKPGQRVMAIFNQTHIKGQIKPSDLSSGLGLPLPGVLTEYRCFPKEGLVAVPDYLTDEEASCLPIASVTAWMAINGFRPLGDPFDYSSSNSSSTPSSDSDGRREVVLIQGTGGVAIAGLQIAHAAGLRTIITSSSDAKLARAKQLGADETINYRTNPDWDQEVLRLTDGEGADIIFENGGARTLRKSFACVRFGGLINCIGYLSGKDDVSEGPGTNVLALMRNVTLKGILNGPRDRFEEMCGFYDRKRIRPVVDRVFGFEEARAAMEYLRAGAHFGKVVVRVA